MQKCTLALGCFWKPEENFKNKPGIIETEVGYAGGEKPQVTYEQVCNGNTGHAEVVRLTFDNGNFYQPVYHENIYPSDETKAEIEASYQNSHVLIYDTAFGLTGALEDGVSEATNEREGEHIKVFFTEEKGLMMDYTTTEGPTTVNVKPDNSVEIINANGDTIVMLNDGNITFTHSIATHFNPIKIFSDLLSSDCTYLK